jgi:hypothetical protein
MDTETMQDQSRTAEERLGALGRRIDGVRDRARDGKVKVDRSIERRLDAVRAKGAEIRTEFRRMAEEDEAAWNADFEALDRELDELDAEVAVVESQLAADAAEDWDAFERAIREELASYDRMLEASRDRMARKKADVKLGTSEAIDRAREKVRAAGEALRRGRTEAAHRWASKREEIRTDMQEVDAAVMDALRDLEGPFLYGGTDRER